MGNVPLIENSNVQSHVFWKDSQVHKFNLLNHPTLFFKRFIRMSSIWWEIIKKFVHYVNVHNTPNSYVWNLTLTLENLRQIKPKNRNQHPYQLATKVDKYRKRLMQRGRGRNNRIIEGSQICGWGCGILFCARSQKFKAPKTNPNPNPPHADQSLKKIYSVSLPFCCRGSWGQYKDAFLLLLIINK